MADEAERGYDVSEFKNRSLPRFPEHRHTFMDLLPALGLCQQAKSLQDPSKLDRLIVYTFDDGAFVLTSLTRDFLVKNPALLYQYYSARRNAKRRQAKRTNPSELD